MSHFSRIQTQIIEQAFLCQALEDLHLQYECGERLQIQGWLDHSQDAQVKVLLPGSSHQIGFARSDENQPYECLADWWGIRDYTERSFIDQVSQRYAYHSTKATFYQQGFDLIEETQEDQRIHLKLRRFA